MSTGFDFGNQTSTIAVTRRGGIDVVANEASNRLNPSMVGFGLKERFAGESAQTQYVTNVKNTISQIKRFLGKKYAEVQDEIKKVPYTVKELPNGEVGFEVFYNGETLLTDPVKVTAILLNKLKQIAQKAVGTTVSDVVISVPPYYVDAQRRALLNAAEIAGLNCLRLMNENVATALVYGFYRLDLPEKEQMNVMFIDCGHSATTCSMVAFSKEANKGKLKVLSTTFDSNLGGRDFDDLLAEHFIAQFKTKYGLDVNTNPRALLRTRVACEKLKQVLSSGVGEAPINIESLMNDVDVSGRMTRKDFEELIQPLLQRIVQVVKSALEEAGLTAGQLASVEIVGGNKRVGAIEKAISDFLGRDLSKTLNDVESVSKGCALQCAMLSPIFKVREFAITDFQPYPIELTWKTANDMQVDNKESSLKAFPRGCPLPATKMVTLKQSGPFELSAHYEDHPYLPPNTPHQIIKVIVPSLPGAKNEKDKLQVRMKVKINQHGILTVDNIEQVEAYEVEEPVPDKKEEKQENKEKSEQPTTESQQTSNTSDVNKPTESSTGATTTKKKYRTTELPYTTQVRALSKDEINSAIEDESKMQAQDRLAVETAEAKNAVESYVYGMRSKISEELSVYALDQEKDAFNSLANEIENWLYEEGDDVSKGVYLDKLNQIRKLGDPISERKSEEYKREAALHELNETINRYRQSINDPKYEHIEQTEKDKIIAETHTLQNHFSGLIGKQSSLPKTATPVFYSGDVINKKKELEKMANAILSKPKPAPAPAPTPTPTPTPNPNETNTSTPDVPMQDAEEMKNQSTPDVPMPDAPTS